LRAPRAARAFVAETLVAWDLRADDVEAVQLVVSELVTNAVLHAAESPAITLELMLTDDAVRVLVSDCSLGEVERRTQSHPMTAETGRGVWLVDAFSDQWGTETRGGNGKTVWCELRVEAPAKP
jgi:anti-sigma regulatory factor (Ser/Thr protein kinase)